MDASRGEGPRDADRFDGGSKAMYGLYRMLTGAVHVSLTTLVAYVELRAETIDHRRCSVMPSRTSILI